MPVIIDVNVGFINCPHCREEFDIIIEILHHLSSEIGDELTEWDIDYYRAVYPNECYNINLSCNGLLGVIWEDGISIVTSWEC